MNYDYYYYYNYYVLVNNSTVFDTMSVDESLLRELIF